MDRPSVILVGRVERLCHSERQRRICLLHPLASFIPDPSLRLRLHSGWQGASSFKMTRLSFNTTTPSPDKCAADSRPAACIQHLMRTSRLLPVAASLRTCRYFPDSCPQKARLWWMRSRKTQRCPRKSLFLWTECCSRIGVSLRIIKMFYIENQWPVHCPVQFSLSE